MKHNLKSCILFINQYVIFYKNLFSLYYEFHQESCLFLSLQGCAETVVSVKEIMILFMSYNPDTIHTMGVLPCPDPNLLQLDTQYKEFEISRMIRLKYSMKTKFH